MGENLFLYYDWQGFFVINILLNIFLTLGIIGWKNIKFCFSGQQNNFKKIIFDFLLTLFLLFFGWLFFFIIAIESYSKENKKNLPKKMQSPNISW